MKNYMMDTLKKEIFWETLGPYYVYGYKNAEGKYVYIGKGKTKRGQSHVQTKDLDIYDLEIIAQNIGSEAEAYLLESYLIRQHRPELNEQSGQHEERFVETKVVDLAEAWEAEQVGAMDIMMKVGTDFPDINRYVKSFTSDQKVVYLKSGQDKKQEIYLSINNKFQTHILIDTRLSSSATAQEKEQFAIELRDQFAAEFPNFDIDTPEKTTGTNKGVKDTVVLYTNALEDGVSSYIQAVKRLRS